MPPQQLYLAHLAPYLEETRTKLEAEMTQLQEENEILMKGIQGQEEEVERIVGGLEAVINDMEDAHGIMEEALGDREARTEAREVDAEIAGRTGGRGSRL